MKFAINTVLWVWPFSADYLDLLEKIKEIGYDAVEFAIEDRSRANVLKIKEALKKTGLGSVTCGAYGPARDLLSPSEEVQTTGINYIKDSIDLCSELGSSALVGPTYSIGIKPGFLNKKTKEQAFDRCVKNLKFVGDYAADKKIRVAVEPLNRYETNFINTAKEARELIDAVDKTYVGVQLDTYHMNIEEKSHKSAIETAGDKLFHLHVPENDRGATGTGNVDWEGVHDALINIKYDGVLAVESCSPEVETIAELGAIWRVYDYDQDELAKKSLSFLRGLFG
ncbi:MAG: sugar phosphate isomerase/epimerase [Actinobacteria bacterium]|nr:sugar phosphate isomerase/epimerase [Actinomycetota bacterium]